MKRNWMMYLGFFFLAVVSGGVAANESDSGYLYVRGYGWPHWGKVTKNSYEDQAMATKDREGTFKYYEKAAGLWERNGYPLSRILALRQALGFAHGVADKDACKRVGSELVAAVKKYPVLTERETAFLTAEAYVKVANKCFLDEDVSGERLGFINKTLNILRVNDFSGYRFVIGLSQPGGCPAGDYGRSRMMLNLYVFKSSMTLGEHLLVGIRGCAIEQGWKDLASEFSRLSDAVLAAGVDSGFGSLLFYPGDDEERKAAEAAMLIRSSNKYRDLGFGDIADLRKKQAGYVMKGAFLNGIELYRGNEEVNKLKVRPADWID